MKKFNRKLIRGTNWALAGLLSLLGFSSCGNQVEEYGTPHADFKVTGRVTDEAGEPLSGIRVVQTNLKSDFPSPYDTVYSSPDGSYRYRYYAGYAPDSLKFTLKFEDPTKRPDYESDSVTVGFAKGDLKGADGSWFLGAAEKEVNVKLKAKKKS